LFMRVLFPSLLLLGALAGCSGSGSLQWYENCGGCGIPSTPPDGGWGPGTCTAEEQIGMPCTQNGATCKTTTDPCVPVRICTTSDPLDQCPGPIP